MFLVHAPSFMKWRFKLLLSVVLSMLVWGMTVMPAFAATPQKTVNASATLAYNLKGLNHNAAVQNAVTH